jgi:kinetochore protein NDC80
LSELSYGLLSALPLLIIFRYEQLTLRANALREELHTEVERMLNDIIKFKVHIQKNLEDYEGFVVEEVEQELGGVDDENDDTRAMDLE